MGSRLVIILTSPGRNTMGLGLFFILVSLEKKIGSAYAKSKSPTAGRLLRGLAFMLYCAQAGRLMTVHVPGVENVMADIASRPSKAQQLFQSTSALSDINFRSSFDTAFAHCPATSSGHPQWCPAG